MQSCPGTYYLIVIEDVKLAKLVACGTLVVEQKFIHDTAVVCTHFQGELVSLSLSLSFCFGHITRDNYRRFFKGKIRVIEEENKALYKVAKLKV